MVQHKKAEVREAILQGAFALFSEHGYAATTLAAIAKSAGVSPGNIYIYFESKLDILYAIYDPWLRARIERLEREIALIRSPHARVRRLLVALWREIPAEENGFLNNIMQAISVTDPREGYRSTLVQWLEDRVALVISGALSPARRGHLGQARLAHVIIMAFDGFAIHRHLHPLKRAIDDVTIDAMATMLTGRRANAADVAPANHPGARRDTRMIARTPVRPKRTASSEEP